MSKATYAKLSVETRPATGPNGEDAEVRCHIEGNVNGLLNAWVQATIHLFNSVIEHEGKEDAMGLYATCQMEVLNALGVDPKKEVEERLRKVKILQGLESILGKTFTMPEQDKEEAE